MFFKSQKQPTGFTLIELLVVISIISLLSSVVMSSLSGARGSARDARRVQDMNQIMTALELYRNQHGYLPGNGGSCDWEDDDSIRSGAKFSESGSCMIQEMETVMSGAVPTDPLSDDDFFYGYDPYHPGNTSNQCDGEVPAAISFNSSETDMDDRETTTGCDQNICDADFNRIICNN